jgi:hypothetical protein
MLQKKNIDSKKKGQARAKWGVNIEKTDLLIK